MVENMKQSSFTMEEIEEVLELIANKRWPGPEHTSEQCYLWSRIRIKLGVHY